ncbi:hypothetical protein [Nitrospirillum iridis]|uniref:Uncharacterized protein n=1 Tax=Nitrospirillum iridis TaxID=765888 RepID=A0A7X0EDW0_9PROT|nr:hypothetical protein [Nitrospirillum iridis]MBB6251401.1 hypothetical protein [Nitrospirillum iridis]
MSAFAIRQAVNAGAQALENAGNPADRAVAAAVVAAFLDALDPAIRIKFQRPLCQHEIDQLGPFKALAEMVRHTLA